MGFGHAQWTVLLVVLLLGPGTLATRTDKGLAHLRAHGKSSGGHGQGRLEAKQGVDTDAKALTSAGEPITLTAVAVGIGISIAAAALYDLAKWSLSDTSKTGTVTVHHDKALSTLAPGEERYPDELFKFCQKSSVRFANDRTGKSTNRQYSWHVFDDKWGWSSDCDFKIKWQWDLGATRWDCRNARDHKDFTGTFSAAAFRVYYTGLKMSFSLANKKPTNTNAYVALGLGLPRSAVYGSDKEKEAWALNPTFYPYAEVWEEGHCSDASDDGGTIWRFFYSLRGNELKYQPPYRSSSGSIRSFTTVSAYRRGSRIQGKEKGAGLSGLLN